MNLMRRQPVGSDAMKLRTIPVLGIRLSAGVLGAFFVVQGITTAGFVAIIGLFGGTLAHVLHVFALIALGIGMTVLGLWMIYGALRNFPHVGSLLRRASLPG